MQSLQPHMKRGGATSVGSERQATQWMISEEESLVHLAAHEVLDPEGEVPDGPLAERLRVGEPQRLRERTHRLDPRRRGLRRAPRHAPSPPLPRSPSPSGSAADGVLISQPPAQHEVEHHGRAQRRRHRRRPHGRRRRRLTRRERQGASP